ncbi:uncharacterized protein LOC125195517 [Salvia hispanica]|uniref:uncharacterized protein LOC125195517 n=1 Tax=Salvia hispanica TaxID=49212 RepID=UPI002009C47E|nr:uncharacterized protein LOC125195517 [Salvia hispanica]
MGNGCFKPLPKDLEPKDDYISITMKDDLFATLPQEIVTDIMRRLTIRSIMRCKFVCKSWLHLIEGVEFAKSYTPEPGLAFDVPGHGFKVCNKTFRLAFEVLLPRPDMPCSTNPCIQSVVIDSVNGLLLM